MPSAGICEAKERIVHVAAWRSHPKRYDDYEDTRNVEEQDEGFQDGQASNKVYVEEIAECDDGDSQEGLMPRLDHVLG